MVGVVLHGESTCAFHQHIHSAVTGKFGRTSNSVRVNEAHRNEVVLFVQVPPVGDSERFVGDGMVDRTPHVDDAHASLQKSFGICTEVTVYTGDGGIIGLVNVDAFL